MLSTVARAIATCNHERTNERTKRYETIKLYHITQKSITYHVRLLVVHAWARKDGNGGWVSGRRGSRPLQFTGARRSCRRRTRSVVGAAGSRAPRAATARGAATGTGPICSLSVELLSFSSLFRFIFLITFAFDAGAIDNGRSKEVFLRLYAGRACVRHRIPQMSDSSYVFAAMNWIRAPAAPSLLWPPKNKRGYA